MFIKFGTSKNCVVDELGINKQLRQCVAWREGARSDNVVLQIRGRVRKMVRRGLKYSRGYVLPVSELNSTEME